MLSVNSSVISPCISQCKLNEDNVCMGCYRSRDEIVDWRTKSEDEKIIIMIRCKKKMAENLQTS